MIQISGLYKSLYGGGHRVDILNNIDLTIPSGQFVAITGASGSGKTTLLSLIAGLDVPTGGTVLIDDKDIKDSLFPSPAKKYADILDQPIGSGFDIQNIISKVIGHYLDKATKQSGGNKSQAAKLLGLPNYQTFTNWIDKYGGSR